MSVPSIPKYICHGLNECHDLKEAPVGHRFSMYFAPGGINKKDKVGDLKAAASISPSAKKMVNAVLSRQLSLFSTLPTNERYCVIGTSTAPFTTGLGSEHPLESGFAFLSPYGLPYLPGSGVKGAVRRAAEELVHANFFGQSGDWTLVDIWHLFGFERWKNPSSCVKGGPSRTAELRDWKAWVDGFRVDHKEIEEYLDSMLIHDHAESTKLRKLLESQDDGKARLRSFVDQSTFHTRGVLEFWDVIPRIDDKTLGIDVMTPHQSHYYEGKEHLGSTSPHDSGAPNPIPFLTVPANATFTFYLHCDVSRLRSVAPWLVEREHWRDVVQAAFEHALKWVGFGAKTSVGFGTMKRDRANEIKAAVRIRREVEVKQRAAREANVRSKRVVQMHPVERHISELIDNREDENMPEITVIFNRLKSNTWTGANMVKAAEWLKSKMLETNLWTEKSRKKNPKKDKNYQRTLFVIKCLKGG